MYTVKAFDTHAEVFTDITSVSDQNIKEIVSLVPKYVTVVLRKQNLTADIFASLIRKIGHTTKPNYYFNHPNYPDICNVTNQKDDLGNNIGVFPEGKINWHSAGNNRKYPEQFIVLYCVKKGLGGDTYFSNGYLSYKDLPDKYKSLSHKIKIVISLNKGDMGFTEKEFEIFKGDFDKRRDKEIYRTITKSLLSYNPYTNKPALYFCYPVINNMYIENNSSFEYLEMFSFLKKHMFQKKYIYHHKWEEGDLIFNDQCSGLHRREIVKKNKIRLLYRIAFNLRKNVYL